MTWTKLSDDFSDDAWKLSDAAFRLHVEALGWSNRKLLDGQIPARDMRRFARAEDPEKVANELVALNFWTREGDGYSVKHHAGYQPSAESVLKKQATARANGKNGGRPRASNAARDTPKPTLEPTLDTEIATHAETQRVRVRDGANREDEENTRFNERTGEVTSWSVAPIPGGVFEDMDQPYTMDQLTDRRAA